MATDECPRQMSEVLIVNRQASNDIMVRSCLPSRYAVEIDIPGNNRSSQRKSGKSWKQGMDMSVDAVTAAHRGRQKSIDG